MNTLAETAFGADAGRWPLPAAHTPAEHWLRAVTAGGQGRYATAFTELDRLARTHGAGPLGSLALSTRASFLRQLGGHASAREWDGRALARAGGHPDAVADAVIGLAADALGVGRFALSQCLLGRAREHVAAATSPRLAIRFSWVSAELAMATGDGAAAVTHAEHAATLAAAWVSVRHAVKSDVVLAAACCCAGDLERSRHIADAAVRTTSDHGLVPLTWALACLLADVGSDAHTPAQLDTLRTASAAAVRDRGGVWSNR
jgi:hypothetical protein